MASFPPSSPVPFPETPKSNKVQFTEQWESADTDASPGHDGPTTMAVLDWNPEQVADAVCSLGAAYQKYRDMIVENGISGYVLCELTDEDLKELGVALGVHRKSILHLATRLTPQAPTQEHSYPPERKPAQMFGSPLTPAIANETALLSEIDTFLGALTKNPSRRPMTPIAHHSPASSPIHMNYAATSTMAAISRAKSDPIRESETDEAIAEQRRLNSAPNSPDVPPPVALRSSPVPVSSAHGSPLLSAPLFMSSKPGAGSGKKLYATVAESSADHSEDWRESCVPTAAPHKPPVRASRLAVSSAPILPPGLMAQAPRAPSTPQEEESMKHTLTIPSRFRGHILGRKGVTLNGICADSGCAIKIERNAIKGPGRDQGSMEMLDRYLLDGTEAGVSVAVEALQAMVSQWDEEKVELPDHIADAVLGRANSTLDQLAAVSGAKLLHVNKGDGQCIEIRGSPHSVALAHNLIDAEIAKWNNAALCVELHEDELTQLMPDLADLQTHLENTHGVLSSTLIPSRVGNPAVQELIICATPETTSQVLGDVARFRSDPSSIQRAPLPFSAQLATPTHSTGMFSSFTPSSTPLSASFTTPVETRWSGIVVPSSLPSVVTGPLVTPIGPPRTRDRGNSGGRMPLSRQSVANLPSRASITRTAPLARRSVSMAGSNPFGGSSFSRPTLDRQRAMSFGSRSSVSGRSSEPQTTVRYPLIRKMIGRVIGRNGGNFEMIRSTTHVTLHVDDDDDVRFAKFPLTSMVSQHQPTSPEDTVYVIVSGAVSGVTAAVDMLHQIAQREMSRRERRLELPAAIVTVLSENNGEMRRRIERETSARVMFSRDSSGHDTTSVLVVGTDSSVDKCAAALSNLAVSETNSS